MGEREVIKCVCVCVYGVNGLLDIFQEWGKGAGMKVAKIYIYIYILEKLIKKTPLEVKQRVVYYNCYRCRSI